MLCKLVRRLTYATVAAALLMAATAAGCGDSSDEGEKDADTSAAKPAERPVPAELVGSYSMVLKPSDLPANPPQELTDRAERWTLTIANKGGPGNSPALALTNDQLGLLESSSLEVDGNRILLHAEECAVAPAPVESEYRWKSDGKTLRFTAVKSGCKDKVSLTLLTAEPWAKHCLTTPLARRDTQRAMSQENVEIVRRLYENFNRGDYAAAVDFLHPDANVYPGVVGLDPLGAGSGDRLSGRDQVRRFFEDLGETWDAVTVELEELIEAGDGTVVSVELWRTRTRDGIEIITPLTDVYTLRDSVIVRVDGFVDKADALEAFGLPG